MEELIVRYLHFIGIILLSSMLVLQNTLFAQTLTREQLRKLLIIDGLYGFSALLTMGAGLTLWLLVGKSQQFYSENPVFHLKLGLFVVVALLSIVTTFFLFKQRNTNNNEVVVPTLVKWLKRLELLFLLVLPWLAVLMSRGVGLS